MYIKRKKMKYIYIFSLLNLPNLDRLLWFDTHHRKVIHFCKRCEYVIGAFKLILNTVKNMIARIIIIKLVACVGGR